MAASDATPWPIRNQAYRVTFPILDADGDLVTGATGLDSEVSKDGGTFADATSEATEIATSSGVYYLDLTATEMDADTVAIIVKTSSSGAKTTTMVLYPITNGLDLPVNVTYFGGSAGTFSGGRPEVNTTHAAGTAWGSGAITAASIANGAIDAATFAADVDAEIAGMVWNAATASFGGAGTYGQAVEDILVDTGTDIPASLTIIDDFLDTEIAVIQTDTSTDIPASIAALNNLSAAQVNAEVVDALATDTYAEPTGVPPATATLAVKLGTLYMALRNRVDVTSTKMTFYDDGGAAEFEKDLSDDGTTYSESEANAI